MLESRPLQSIFKNEVLVIGTILNKNLILRTEEGKKWKEIRMLQIVVSFVLVLAIHYI